VLEDLAFLRPLIIAENRSRLVQLVIAPAKTIGIRSTC
jgi:hypothetical protein